MLNNSAGNPKAPGSESDSISQVMSEIGVEIRAVGGLDACLALVRLSRRRGEFRQTALVGRIQAEEVILVQFRHSLGELKKRFAALPHVRQQPRGGRALDIVNFRPLLFEGGRI